MITRLTVPLSGLIAGLFLFAATAHTADLSEKNRSVDDVIAAYDNLADQGEWLGYYLERHERQYTEPGEVFELFPGSLKAHIQGVARSPRTDGPPVFYVTVSEGDFAIDGYAGIMVVEMQSRLTDGERLGSNRLLKGKDTMFTRPPTGSIGGQEVRPDKVVKFIETKSHHPSGISMVGDILAVPMGGFVHFYDTCSDPDPDDPDLCSPTNPKMLKYALPLIDDFGETTGAQGVAITNLPNGHFLLLTNSGSGAHFYFSSKTSFFKDDGTEEENIFHKSIAIDDPVPPDWTPWSVERCNEELRLIDPDNPDICMRHQVFRDNYQFKDKTYLESLRTLDDQADAWPFKDGDGEWSRTFQGINFVNEAYEDEVDTHGLFLIGSANSNTKTPRKSGWGHDELYLLEVCSHDNLPEDPPVASDSCNALITLGRDSLHLIGVARTEKKTRSPGAKNNGNMRDAYIYSARNRARDDNGNVWTSFLEFTKRWQANFNAGAGAYVSPAGELLYYAASHFADGDVSRHDYYYHDRASEYWDHDFVKMAEYGNRYVSMDEACGAMFREQHLGGDYTITEAHEGLTLNGEVQLIEPWVRMYQDAGQVGQSVMMDWRNQADEDYDKFSDLDGEYGECRRTAFDWADGKQRYNGFNNCMSSFFWCGPTGATLRFYKADLYVDELMARPGDGSVWRESLEEDDALNNEASSAKIDWLPPVIDYDWSLSGEGALLENPDPPYRQVYTPGSGNSTNEVTLTVMGESHTAYITVTNVAPEIGDLQFSPDLPEETLTEGQFLQLDVQWSDPGVSSAMTEVDWGDGTLEAKTTASSTGFDFDHVYADNGDYWIEACVDDGEEPPESTTCRTEMITVDNAVPAASINGLTDELGAWIGAEVPVALTLLEVDIWADFIDMGTLDTHTATVNWGDAETTAGVVTETPSGHRGTWPG